MGYGDPLMYFHPGMAMGLPPMPHLAAHDGSSVILPIPADRVGLVVGKGGATIRHIQETTKTHVHVPPAAFGMRVCNLQINGRPEHIAACVSMVRQCIAPLVPGMHPIGAAVAGAGPGSRRAAHPAMPPLPIDTVGIQGTACPWRVEPHLAAVPMQLVPFLVGPNGEHIPFYEEQTGARLFFGSMDESQGLQELFLSGPRPQVLALQQMLRARLGMAMPPPAAPEPASS